ncbi:MAG: hypothetical protein ABII24_04085 [bacterium]
MIPRLRFGISRGTPPRLCGHPEIDFLMVVSHRIGDARTFNRQIHTSFQPSLDLGLLEDWDPLGFAWDMDISDLID